jgi:hypothetical protein
MHACKNNITSPPDCVEGATAQIKKNLLLPPMHNGLAVGDLCSVPDLHFDPLQMGREPALSSVGLSLSTRAALGRAHVVASNCPIGAVVDTAERGFGGARSAVELGRVQTAECAIHLTRVRRCASRQSPVLLCPCVV